MSDKPTDSAAAGGNRRGGERQTFWEFSVNFDFMKLRHVATAFSLTLILISLGSLAFRGLNFGLDFTGGGARGDAGVFHGAHARFRERVGEVARAGEIVAVVGEGEFRNHLPNCSCAWRNSGLAAATCSRARPARAPSHAARILAAPAAMPPGCPMMPPPAAWIRSDEPRAA